MGPHTYKAIRRFQTFHPIQPHWNILEVGSADVNGGIRRLFSGYASYTGCDLHGGDGVDLVVRDGAMHQQIQEKFELILCCDVLEHTLEPWRIMEEIAQMLSPGGILFALAPFAWPQHRHPVDCFRFAPDGFEHLSKRAGLTVLDCYHFSSSGFPPLRDGRMWMHWLHAKLWGELKLRFTKQHTGFMHTALTAQKPL